MSDINHFTAKYFSGCSDGVQDCGFDDSVQKKIIPNRLSVQRVKT